jgi:hypothetical protein
MLAGGFSDEIERLREAIFENDPRPAKLREKSQMTFAAGENLRRCDGAHSSAGKTSAAVVANPD